MTRGSLFVYGTLQDPDIVRAVLGRVPPSTPATAPGHCAVYYPGRPYPALVAASGTDAPGLWLTGLAPDDMAMLDAFEGSEYRRAAITIATAAGDMTVPAYLPAVPVPADAEPWTLQDWTLRHKPAVLTAETAGAIALRQALGLHQP